MTELETSYTQKTREVQQRLYEESHTRQATQNSLADEQKQNERLLESKATLVAEHQVFNITLPLDLIWIRI